MILIAAFFYLTSYFSTKQVLRYLIISWDRWMKLVSSAPLSMFW